MIPLIKGLLVNQPNLRPTHFPLVRSSGKMEILHGKKGRKKEKRGGIDNLLTEMLMVKSGSVTVTNGLDDVIGGLSRGVKVGPRC